ncbi:MAG TPA: murein biosynthesis integral membrane protein MurJ [Thermoanaerobaculia bacterium]|nr:murein biosynthesis integral membrane protein MurJ [Thermoanaerobaculia bacterium]
MDDITRQEGEGAAISAISASATGTAGAAEAASGENERIPESGGGPAVGGAAEQGCARDAGRAARGGAVRVGAGILLSRLAGLAREQAVAFFFGVGPHADALTAALRVPNALQNLLGEGALSASFIPIYSRMLEAGKRDDAGRFAGAIFGLLLATAAAVTLAGIALAGPLVALLAPGFLADARAHAPGTPADLAVDRYALTVGAVRILFPMTGLLVLSVWALGVLNSHRRFFLPYFAPVLWNSAMIAALLVAGGRHPHPSPAGRDGLLTAFCWGAVAGGLLQFGVQLPAVARVIRGFRLSFSTRVTGVRQALAAWGPVVAGRGVVQLAGYLDLFLATWLATGAAGANRYAQMLYILPISLFGMSIAASELPELARLQASDGAAALLTRVRRALGSVAFLNIPTVVAYLAFGFLVVGAVYRRGSFNLADNWLVYLALCGYSTGILATTSSRLLQNTFYALGDTRTPARIAVLRVAISALLAVPLMLWLDRIPVAAIAGPQSGQRLYLGAVGLALASGAGAWIELVRLRSALRRHLPAFELPWRDDARILVLAAAAALVAAVCWRLLPRTLPQLLTAAVVLGSYGAAYLLAARLAGRSELTALLGRLPRTGR